MTKRAVVKVAGEIVRVGNTHNWRGLIATFVASQDVKESSRSLYTRTLTQFFKWVNETGKTMDSMTREDILEYKDHLTEEALSALTIGSYIVAVRKFYEWVEANKLYPNIAKGIKTPPRKQAFKKQHLTDAKSTELLEHFKEMSLRDFAIVNLILRTGLRTIEVVRADIADITFRGDRRILKVWGKGKLKSDKEDDFVVLSDKVYTPIAEYLATRKGAKSGEPLFVSNSRQNKGERLTTRTISYLCKEGMRAIGLDGKEFSAHSLRHTTAVAILKQGGSITDVQGVLRHSSPVTSQIYTESIKEEMRLKSAPELMLDNAF
jgi:integrase/recombinase XerC/integrase/recombinase XerD